jgi:hypothetical protein
MENIAIALLAAVSSTSLASLLLFLLRNWIIERLKGSIQHEYALMLESYKSQIIRREQAYEEIVNALYDTLSYLCVQKEDYGQGTGLTDERENEIRFGYLKASSSLNRATDIGSLFISNEATDILRKLRNRAQLDYDNEPRFEFYNQEYIEHKAALSKILKVAIVDLKRT